MYLQVLSHEPRLKVLAQVGLRSQDILCLHDIFAFPIVPMRPHVAYSEVARVRA